MSWVSEKRMSSRDFEATKPMLTNMSDDRIEAARLALVDSMKHREIAEKFGRSMSWVNDAKLSVWHKFLRLQTFVPSPPSVEVPRGWERVEIIAPKAIIDRVRKEIEEYPVEEVKQQPQTTRRDLI